MKVTKKQLQEMVRKEAKKQLKLKEQKTALHNEDFLEYAGSLKRDAEDVFRAAETVYEMARDVKEMEGSQAAKDWNEDSDIVIGNLTASVGELMETLKALKVV